MTSLPTPSQFTIGFQINSIQAVRLAHALMESDYEVSVSASEAGKLVHLRDTFGLSYAIDGQGPTLPATTMDHSLPETGLGSLRRPLIYPRAIFDHCANSWGHTRLNRFFFGGLLTSRRRRTMDEWLGRNAPGAKLPSTWLRQIQRRVDRSLRGLARPKIRRTKIGDLIFWESNRGRVFPGKAWDSAYMQELVDSQFALCPSGDYVWTYRFFEAAMCGAIPVVEESCPAYQGFIFYHMTDNATELRWSERSAEHNYSLARARLTIDRNSLNAEIASLLEYRS